MPRVMRAPVKQALTKEARVSGSHEEIARVAFELFQQRGAVHGFDQQDWFEAERIVRPQRRSA